MISALPAQRGNAPARGVWSAGACSCFVLFWSAPACWRFLKRRLAAAFQGVSKLPHSRISRKQDSANGSRQDKPIVQFRRGFLASCPSKCPRRKTRAAAPASISRDSALEYNAGYGIVRQALQGESNRNSRVL